MAEPQQTFVIVGASLAGASWILLSTGWRLTAAIGSDTASYCWPPARPRASWIHPGADLDGVLYLRRLKDSERLREAIRGGGRVVVVGAGWTGLETAAAAREYGWEVTVIEPQPALLQAPLGPGAGDSVIGGFFAQVHREHGVSVQLGTAVTEFHGTEHASRQ